MFTVFLSSRACDKCTKDVYVEGIGKVFVTTHISLIITSYNREQYLKEAIESILAQSYPYFELLIWDDGSQDNSLRLAQSYADRDTRIRVQAAPHQGLSCSLHDAVAATKYPYLGWVDSDDRLAPTALAETVAILDSQPDTGLVYTNYQNIDAAGSITGIGDRCHIPYSPRKLLVSFMTFHFRLIRRSLYNQVGGINPAFERAEDYDLCLRLSEVTQFYHLKRPLYFYRQHAGNVTNNEIEMLRWSYKASQNALKRRGMSEQYEIAIKSAFALRRKPETLPLVSIIITSYNAEATIEACLKSCFSQSYNNLEIIVVDNNSTDNTPQLLQQIAEAAPCPFRLVRCADQGQNHAHNYGFLQAKGDYIQWLDSDDELEPRKLAKQVTALEQNESYDIAYSDWQWCFYKNQQLSSRLSFVGRQYGDFLLQLLMDNWRPPHAYLLRRKAAAHLQSIQAWHPDTTACTDREYYTLAALEGFQFLYVPDTGVRYNAGLSAQVTRSTPYEKRVRNLQRMFERFRQSTEQTQTTQLKAPHHFLLQQNRERWQPAFSLLKLSNEGCHIQHNATGKQAVLRKSEARIVRSWLKFSGAYTLEDHARYIVRQLWQEIMMEITQTQGAQTALDQAFIHRELSKAVGLVSSTDESTDELSHASSAAVGHSQENNCAPNCSIESAVRSPAKRLVKGFPLCAPMFNEQRTRVHSVLEQLRLHGWLERASAQEEIFVNDSTSPVLQISFKDIEQVPLSKARLAKKTKVFGIGLGKTGTTSLCSALSILGYKAIHLPKSIDCLDQYDAATDTSVAIAFKELSRRYPNAKFILTVRPVEDWLSSWAKHDQKVHTLTNGRLPSLFLQLRIQTFGQCEFDPIIWKARYERHLREIDSYFSAHPSALLRYDICGGEQWKPLCEFLELPLPQRAFPRQNQTVKV